jgi:hypothetical protein
MNDPIIDVLDELRISCQIVRHESRLIYQIICDHFFVVSMMERGFDPMQATCHNDD